MKVELISWTHNPIKTIAQAAAVCYDSEPNVKIVKQCIASGHHSVLEHASFTFRIEGISRACSHQLVRHRIASYSQQSQRYVNLGKLNVEEDFVYPNYASERALSEYDAAFNNALELYLILLRIGEAKEDARSVLPNACPTTIYVTMNLRSLAHFMNERLCSRAQAEIKKMAGLMKKAVKDKQEDMQVTDEEMDIIQNLFVPKCEAGKIIFCPEHQSCGRHTTAKEINEILTKIETIKKERRNGEPNNILQLREPKTLDQLLDSFDIMEETK